MTNQIDISSALKQFDILYDDDGQQIRTYGIKFITADGRVREIFDARKNVKNPKAENTGESDKKSKQKYHLKTYGTMKLYDENAEEYRDVKVAQMIAFRPYNSKKWIPIFH